jgi:hypothetical protein
MADGKYHTFGGKMAVPVQREQRYPKILLILNSRKKGIKESVRQSIFSWIW